MIEKFIHEKNPFILQLNFTLQCLQITLFFVLTLYIVILPQINATFSSMFPLFSESR